MWIWTTSLPEVATAAQAVTEVLGMVAPETAVAQAAAPGMEVATVAQAGMVALGMEAVPNPQVSPRPIRPTGPPSIKASTVTKASRSPPAQRQERDRGALSGL